VAGSIDFEWRRVPFEDGDTVASAVHRTGVRTWNRSLKYHRRRGLYCLTGDCSNCLVNVDGEPGRRACVTEAIEGARVRRETGSPGPEWDVLAITDRMHWLMPVGFYYKAFIRPRWAWEFAERMIRRATGVGRLPTDGRFEPKRARTTHCDVLVVGGGVAGLAAAIAAAQVGERTLLADEGALGWSLSAPALQARIEELSAEARAQPNVEILQGHSCIGLYEGPSAALVGPHGLVEVEAGRVIVATGAVEAHGVFPGNDLPGVWLGRGAARMAVRHGVAPGNRAVIVGEGPEVQDHADALRDAGAEVSLVAGRVVSANGRRRVTGVTVETADGRRSFACDALVLALGHSPRDALLRMASGLPVGGAGDVVLPGCTPEEAEASGRRAGAGEPDAPSYPVSWPAMEPDGYVCICEDVGVHELEVSWDEGWTSSEILKRYTTATMGPCQGALCGRHLAFFAESKGAPPAATGLTTARPPVRAPKLEDLVGGVHEVIHKRTALHERHVSAGARMDRSGAWQRPGTYGDRREGYLAVRERVSLMDVSTLAKFLVAGRDAAALIDRVFPTRVRDLAPGRARYLLALDEAGYVMDDGLLSALPDGRYYLTSTSGGADRMEAWLRNWSDRLDLSVHVVNQTAQLGAINVAGPHARDLLVSLSGDDLSREAIGHPGHADVTVAGVACRAIAVGFVGETSFELHHPRSRSVELWDALLEAGHAWDIRPHGLDALDLLRLEKGHIYLAQDTMPDDHPGKLGLSWAVEASKPWFVGKASLERMAALPLQRRLLGLEFDRAPQRGAPLSVDGRIVGRVTSCGTSEVLGRHIGLGWVRCVDGVFPETLNAGALTARVAPTPFYDPEGVRLRA